NNSTFTKDTPPTLPYRVGQTAKRQAKQLNAVLWRGGSLTYINDCLPAIIDYENTATASYGSVSGENYKSDLTFISL
ncbi:MAG: hypothetical protein LBD86_06035, partial [Spirochaetaceae bacterium]|nr:hypothetical protein [Spirochaetaceae bacterium]